MNDSRHIEGNSPNFEGGHVRTDKGTYLFRPGVETVNGDRTIVVRDYANVLDGAGYWVVAVYNFDASERNDIAYVILYPVQNKEKPIYILDESEPILRFTNPENLGNEPEDITGNLQEAVDRIKSLLENNINPSELMGRI